MYGKWKVARERAKDCVYFVKTTSERIAGLICEKKRYMNEIYISCIRRTNNTSMRKHTWKFFLDFIFEFAYEKVEDEIEHGALDFGVQASDDHGTIHFLFGMKAKLKLQRWLSRLHENLARILQIVQKFREKQRFPAG